MGLDQYMQVTSKKLAQKVYDWDFIGKDGGKSTMVSQSAVTGCRDLTKDLSLADFFMDQFCVYEQQVELPNGQVGNLRSQKFIESFARECSTQIAAASNEQTGLIGYWRKATWLNLWFDTRSVEKYGRPLANNVATAFDYNDMVDLSDELLAVLNTGAHSDHGIDKRVAEAMFPMTNEPLAGDGSFWASDCEYDDTFDWELVHTGLLISHMIDQPEARNAKFLYTAWY